MFRLLVIALVLICTPAFAKEGAFAKEATEPYEPNLESLAKHTAAPEWFRDAKLGIYFHWGVYSVPAFGNEWYPRHMHFKHRHEHKHHVEKYGHPSKFGYHDFVPMFKAEKFDAAEWAELFEKAGARFAGPVAEHHDGFSMWESRVNPWNAANMGPKRDITGELEREIRKRGMKFIATFHHARHLQRYAGDEYERDKPLKIERRRWSNSHYPFVEGMPPTSEDSQLKLLYGYIPEAEWLERMWLGKLKEVIDAYHPDIIWFDSWLDQVPREYHEKFAAYYLNRAAEWGAEVMIVRKQKDLPLEYSINDLEKGRMNRLTEEVWLTDDTISKGSWCYTEDLKIKSLKEVLTVFIDIVSKNGQLLLNISPKADGSIPQEQRQVLLGLGQWLEKYGEAIYETRPFVVFGEGPTRLKGGGHFVKEVSYTPQDIRYTRKGNTVYAIQLGSPAAGAETVLATFGKEGAAGGTKVTGVSLLGVAGELKWSTGEAGLSITAPSEVPEENAIVYKITTE